jgi:Large eukaryotic DNA virus major capsid protein
MKVKDYNSSDATLRRQHLDKWHTFSKITPTSRSTQGWRQGQVKLVNSAVSLQAGVFNNSGSATAQLTYTTTATAGSYFGSILVGDVLTVTRTSNSAVVELTVVAKVDAASAASVLTFNKLVGDVNSTSIFGTTNLAQSDVSVSQSRPTSAEATTTVSVASPTVDSVTIKAHGIPIYNGFVDSFYNAYLPYHFGGPNVNVPKDTGALFIPFCLYPGSYQPSGHINVSRAREFYLEYSSSVVDTNTPGTLVVAASAINFLLISDGSAKLLWHSDKSNFIASTIVLCNTPFIRESLDMPLQVC